MVRAALFALAFSALLAPLSSHAQCAKKQTVPKRDYDYFESFPYTKQILKQSDLDAIQETDRLYRVKAIRGIIFGRHGRIFRDSNIRNYLEESGWYKPNPKFKNSVLNANERANLDLVRAKEAELHEKVMPGDLRFWMDKTIPASRLGTPSLVDLHIMRSEIEAIHGKRFDDEPLLQKYFNERYWYKPAARYNPKELNEHELANLKLLAKAEDAKRGTALSPGSMLVFGDRPIRKEMLEALNLHELRLLRNEVYAMRGASFQTAWLQEHFDGEEWYEPLPKGQKPKLTTTDERNIATILSRENELHQALSVKTLKPADLEGMMSDDIGLLKNEIYARRGKTFHSKWIQGYFASLPWYKPNPAFRDSLLTSVERKNIALLAKFEKKKADEESMAEG